MSTSKPNPEVFLKAAEYLNISPDMCLVVEDAVAGVGAAITGRMDSCAIGDVVSSCKANYYLNTFNNKLKVVE
ncbi:HAD-IA family hydrolase [Neobacillus vireti]|uniref:HAD-IA family hydrolase n=1 Tax=Neobacillus vireti TaxID=220686 RepID=UPI00300058FA